MQSGPEVTKRRKDKLAIYVLVIAAWDVLGLFYFSQGYTQTIVMNDPTSCG